MKIDTQQALMAYIKYRLEAGLSAPLAINFPKLEEVLRKTFESVQLSGESPDEKTAPMNKEESAQGGDLRLHLGVEQVHCTDRGRWIKHDNPEWIALRKAVQPIVKKESIITVAEAFKKAGMKDLTPDQIKKLAETPRPHPLEDALSVTLTGGTVIRAVPSKCSRCGRDFSPGNTILTDDAGKECCTRSDCFFASRKQFDPPECKRCNCVYLAEGCEPYDHGFCGECACKELEELQVQLSTKMSALDEGGQEFKPLLDEERLAVIQTAWYDMRNDSERQHHGWMVRLNETVNNRNEQLKELTKGRYKLIKEVSELRRGVAYVALMKRIDELEIELLEYQNLHERMIDDKKQVRVETQGALGEAGKQIDSLTAANKAQGKHYREQQKLLSDRLARRHKALVAAGVELEEKGEEIIVDLTTKGYERFGSADWSPTTIPIASGSDLCPPTRATGPFHFYPGTHCAKHSCKNLRRSEGTVLCEEHWHYWASTQGVRDGWSMDGMHAWVEASPCAVPPRPPAQATPGYGPVNEDPTIGPDLKPHDKMSRQQLLSEVKRLERLVMTVGDYCCLCGKEAAEHDGMRCQ